MSELNIQTVKSIAELARLALSSQETEALTQELKRILDLVEQMNAVDTSNVVPMAHPLHMPQRLRPDQVTETDHRQEYQGVAPQTENGLYLVPRVIE